MNHFRKTRIAYKKHTLRDTMHGECAFCVDTNMEQRALMVNQTMLVVPNRTQYDLFEGRRVIDHLMVIPRRHVETLSKLSVAERIDLMTIIGDYEVQGYNTYARGVGSISRSVSHQHTHLIKLADAPLRLIFHIRRPYIVLYK